MNFNKFGKSNYDRNKEAKIIKKKALGKNYKRVAWQDSPDTSDEEERLKKFGDRGHHSSQESEMRDELERVRKNYKRRMDGLERKNKENGFNFEKNFFY